MTMTIPAGPEIERLVHTLAAAKCKSVAVREAIAASAHAADDIIGYDDCGLSR
jgi:hypothetical protein